MYSNRLKGFTLIELMITVAIIGILSAIAYPAYTSQIEKGRRAECRSGLLKTMQQQERFFTQMNQYTAFTQGAASAAVSSYSGETLQSSACQILAQACGALPLTSCVEMTGFLPKDSRVAELYYNSQGLKQCKLKGSSALVTDTTLCWP